MIRDNHNDPAYFNEERLSITSEVPHNSWLQRHPSMWTFVIIQSASSLFLKWQER